MEGLVLLDKPQWLGVHPKKIDEAREAHPEFTHGYVVREDDGRYMSIICTEEFYKKKLESEDFE